MRPDSSSGDEEQEPREPVRLTVVLVMRNKNPGNLCD